MSLTYQPDHHVTVEDLVIELEGLFLPILVDEGGLQLALVAGGETLHLYLPCEVHTVAGQKRSTSICRAKSTPLRDMRL